MDANGAAAATGSQRIETRDLLEETRHTLAVNDPDSAAALAGANEEIQGLREALRTRTLIGQAIGMLMTEKRLSTDEAFAELVETSSQSNLKLRDVAARMVELANAGAERRRNTTP